MKKAILLTVAIATTLFAFAQPVNDECVNATSLTVGLAPLTIMTPQLDTATQSPDPLPACFTATNLYDYYDVWYKVSTTKGGNLWVSANFTSTYFAVYDACGGNELSCFTRRDYTYDLPAGDYYVRVAVRDFQAAVTPATLTFQMFEKPSNDECANATPLNVSIGSSITIMNDTLRGATQSADALPSCFSFPGLYEYHDAWYDLTLATDGTLEVDLGNGNVIGALYSGTGCIGTFISCSNNYLFGYNMTAGTYKLRIATLDYVTSIPNSTLELFAVPSNDECANAINISVDTGSITSVTTPDLHGASQSAEALTACQPFPALYQYHDVWYEVNVVSPGNLRIFNSSSVLQFGLYNVCGGVENQDCFAGNDIYYDLPIGSYRLRVSTEDFRPTVRSFDLEIYPGVSNDECINAISVPITVGTPTTVTTENLFGASQSPQTLSSCFAFPTTYQYLDVWYAVTQPVDGSLKLSGNSSLYASIYDVCSGAEIDCQNGNAIQFNDLTAGSNYLIRAAVQDFRGNAQTFSMEPVAVPFDIAETRDATCHAAVSVTIDSASGNTDSWVPLVDASGDIIAAILANGQNLGTCDASYWIDDVADFQTNANMDYYARREVTVTTQNLFSNPIGIRLYLTNDEFYDLNFVDNSIFNIGALDVMKTEVACGVGYTNNGFFIPSNGQPYGADYSLEFQVSDLSTFFFTGSPLLPVELTSFEAEENGEVNSLTWETATELNSKSFSIERSNDGKVWNEIATIAAQGNSTTPKGYQYEDANPLPVSWYRLKMIDLDESYAYSEVDRVARPLIANIEVYPNPTSGKLRIELPLGVRLDRLVLRSASGVILSEQRGGQQVNLKNIPAGMYLLELTTSHGKFNNRIVKIE